MVSIIQKGDYLMETIRFKINDQLNILDELSLCLGYFDGLHLGHMRLIDKAKESVYKSAVLTFEFADNINIKNSKYLTSFADKQRILTAKEVDYLLVLYFNQETMNLSSDCFIQKVIKKFNVKEIIVGEDFRFGYQALGNIELLKTYQEFKTIVIEELKDEEKKIGTSTIIKLIENGDIEKANKLLGYNYKITGRVKKGFKFGRKNHFPTANVELNNYVIPKYGVYACIISFNNKSYKAMANIGTHPTVNKLEKALLEVNIFDFNENIYDQIIAVELISFIREEKKFSSSEELYKQIIIDQNSCLIVLKKA